MDQTEQLIMEISTLIGNGISQLWQRALMNPDESSLFASAGANIRFARVRQLPAPKTHAVYQIRSEDPHLEVMFPECMYLFIPLNKVSEVIPEIMANRKKWLAFLAQVREHGETRSTNGDDPGDFDSEDYEESGEDTDQEATIETSEDRRGDHASEHGST